VLRGCEGETTELTATNSTNVVVRSLTSQNIGRLARSMVQLAKVDVVVAGRRSGPCHKSGRVRESEIHGRVQQSLVSQTGGQRLEKVNLNSGSIESVK
jgi:hypothetical protein